MHRLVLALVLAPLAAGAAPLTVKGSDTMVILVQRWAEAFMQRNPDAKVQVTGGGSGTGIAALVNGTTEIAASSREMKPAEEKKVLARSKVAAVATSVAKDGVAFYVNASNPVDELTVDQLRAIYLGDVTNWKDVGGPDARIVLYSRESSSGTYVFTKEVLLDGGDFAPQAQTLPGTAAVVNAVSREKHGIGYGGAAYATGVKVLRVKGPAGVASPDLESVRSGRYALARDLYFYTRGAPTGLAKAFVDFCLSPEGQALVSKVGYYPLR